MKSRSLEFVNRPWMYLTATMALLITVTVFFACQTDEANTVSQNGKMTKITETTCFVESNPNKSLAVPPPPEQGKMSSGSSLGYKIYIAENTTFGMSHTFRTDSGCEKEGLIVLCIYDKGDLKLEWSDPGDNRDTRLKHVIDAIENNCVIVISVNEMKLLDAKGNVSAENFWKQFNMAPMPQHPIAPDQEYFVKRVTGVSGYINIINGTLKVL